MPGSVILGKLKYTKIDDPENYAADLIASDHIIAWWQGKSEYGPRALGGRSILANPRAEGVRDAINNKVKRREWFRPFGPAVREEEVTTYLDAGLYTQYMTSAPKVNGNGAKALGECVHTDMTCRIQAVPAGRRLCFRRSASSCRWPGPRKLHRAGREHSGPD